MWAKEEIMAHAAPFTDQGTSIRERTKNIVSPAVDPASHFEQLIFMPEEKLYIEDEIRSEQGFEEIIGRSSRIRAVLRDTRQRTTFAMPFPISA